MANEAPCLYVFGTVDDQLDDPPAVAGLPMELDGVGSHDCLLDLYCIYISAALLASVSHAVGTPRTYSTAQYGTTCSS